MQSIRYRLVFAAAALLVIFNALLAYRSLSAFADSQKWQNHTLEVLGETSSMLAKARTAESQAREYVLVPSAGVEEQYQLTVSSVWASLDHLRELTGDNASQQKRLDAVRDRIAAHIAALDAGIQLRKVTPDTVPTPLQLAVMNADNRKYATFSVPYAIAQLEGEERRLLNNRNVRTNTSRRDAYVTFGIATLLDVLFLIVAFWFLQKETSARIQLAHQSKEIQTLNADLERRVQERTFELQTSNQELEAFSYSVSHDLRAPLRTIDGFSLALQEDYADKFDEEGRDYINRVRSGVQRMGQLIDALLQLSRVTRAELVEEYTDLAEMARSVATELKIGDVRREINFIIPATPVFAQADQRLLRVALENLMGNAFKFTSKTANAVIEFGTLQKEGETVYFVRDNGAGFDMYYVDRLFTAFQRLHGDRDFKGSGIGLATTLRIIRRHKGRIWAEGKENEGATFYFTLGA